MLTILNRIKEGIGEVLFPNICVVCGLKLSPSEKFVCAACLQTKFDTANPEGLRVSGDTLLPEGIAMQHALWRFDKGGYLQDLLHNLKYNRLTGVGEDIGKQLGMSLLKNPHFNTFKNPEDAALLPVPLHLKKKRLRGYNQAFYIAKGVSEVTAIPVIGRKCVQRIRNTKTQTGFTLEKRKQNMEGAFRVFEPEAIQNKFLIIIDDVFTTGATTFELAGELQRHSPQKIVIATVAQA